MFYFHYNLPPSSFDEDTFSSPSKTFNQVYEGLTDVAVVGPSDESSSLTLTTPSSMPMLNDLFGNSPPSWTVATWDDESSDDCWRVSGGTWQQGGTVGGLDSSKSYVVEILAPNPNSGREIGLRVNGGAEQKLVQTDDPAQSPVAFTISGATSAAIEAREVAGGSVYVKSFRIYEYVTPPSLSVTQASLSPGGAISGNYSDFLTVPTTLTVSDGTNTITIASPTISVNGDGTGTFSGTMPSLPTSGTADLILFGDVTVELS